MQKKNNKEFLSILMKLDLDDHNIKNFLIYKLFMQGGQIGPK